MYFARMFVKLPYLHPLLWGAEGLGKCTPLRSEFLIYLLNLSWIDRKSYTLEYKNLFYYEGAVK
jgi:hypothetical protein